MLLVEIETMATKFVVSGCVLSLFVSIAFCVIYSQPPKIERHRVDRVLCKKTTTSKAEWILKWKYELVSDRTPANPKSFARGEIVNAVHLSLSSDERQWLGSPRWVIETVTDDLIRREQLTVSRAQKPDSSKRK